MTSLARIAATTLAGALVVAGLWAAAAALALLDPALAGAASTVVSPADADASVGANVDTDADADADAGGGAVASPLAVPDGAPDAGVDLAGGRAAADVGFRAGAADGPAWAGNPLATPLLIANGQMKARPVSFRFRASADGCATGFRTWWRYSDPDKPDSTYSGGDGGRYRVELRPDDGAGRPGEPVLDAGEFVPDVRRHPNSSHDDQYREVELSARACLERGRTYHVVLVNVAPDPDAAFVSFNGPYLRDGFQNAAEANGCPECTDHAALRLEADGSWILFPDDHTPAMVYRPFWCAALDTGVAVGQSMQYGHQAVDPPPLVSGPRRVRQLLAPAAPGDALPAGPATLSFYAKRNAGDAPLEVRVNGREVGRVTMPTASGVADERSDGRAFDWYAVELDAAPTADGALAVEFRTAASTEYEIAAGVRTAKLCGVPVAGEAAGRAELSDDAGESWTGPTVFGKPDKPNVQLSLVLTGGR